MLRHTDVPSAVRSHIHNFKDSLAKKPIGKIYEELLEMLHDPSCCRCGAGVWDDPVSLFSHAEYETYCSLVWRAVHDAKPGLTECLRTIAKRRSRASKAAPEATQARALQESFPEKESKSWPATTTR